MLHSIRMGQLSMDEIARAVRQALAEDIGSGDVTTLATVPEVAQGRAVMKAREALVPAGLMISEVAFRELSPGLKITHLTKDGEPVSAGTGTDAN